MTAGLEEARVDNSPARLREFAERAPRILPSHLDPDALGIVVFGPGTGEAMVVRLPDGRIGVLDGCREPEGRRLDGRGDPVREFLNGVAGLDRDGDGRLWFVGLTHPHSDHYRGLGRLLKSYLDRVDRLISWSDPAGQAVEILQQILREREVTRKDLIGLERVVSEVNGFSNRRPVQHTRQFTQNMTLYEGDACRYEYRVISCGPSQGDWLRRWRAILAEGHFDLDQDPNRLSGAFRVHWGRAGVLLAGDLLAQHGWDALREDFLPCHAPPARWPIQVAKVSHHASEGAHDVDLWSALNPALAIVTPFKNASDGQPPRPEDIRRLCSGSCSVAITSPPAWTRGDSRAVGHPRPEGIGGDALSDDEKHSAVAVSIGSRGQITRIVLGGEADFYACDPESASE